MTRLGPPDPGSLPTETNELLALASGVDGRPLLTIGVLAHNPALVGPFLGWAAALALQGTLPKRDHELLALRTAFCCASAFEWEEHTRYATDAGLTADEIARVRVGPDADGWDEHERALLRAADELHRDHTVTASTWATLAAVHPADELVEILYVVGQYTMLSMVANAVVG
jgi:alkylhydroperoxidase family enzyme